MRAAPAVRGRMPGKRPRRPWPSAAVGLRSARGTPRPYAPRPSERSYSTNVITGAGTTPRPSTSTGNPPRVSIMLMQGKRPRATRPSAAATFSLSYGANQGECQRGGEESSEPTCEPLRPSAAGCQASVRGGHGRLRPLASVRRGGLLAPSPLDQVSGVILPTSSPAPARRPGPTPTRPIGRARPRSRATDSLPSSRRGR